MNNEQLQIKTCVLCRGKGKVQYVVAGNSVLETWKVRVCPYCDGTGIAREMPKESHDD